MFLCSINFAVKKFQNLIKHKIDILNMLQEFKLALLIYPVEYTFKLFSRKTLNLSICKNYE